MHQDALATTLAPPTLKTSWGTVVSQYFYQRDFKAGVGSKDITEK